MRSMKTGILAAVLILLVAVQLASAAPGQKAQRTATVITTLQVTAPSGAAQGDVYWVNATWNAVEEGRLVSLLFGIYTSQPLNPAVFTVYVDGKLVFNASSTAYNPPFVKVDVPAANGTLKPGSRDVRVKFIAPDATSTAHLVLVFARNITVSVDYDREMAAVSGKVTAVKGGLSTSLREGEVSGYDALYMVGRLHNFESDKAIRVFEDSGFVVVLNEAGFPTQEFSFTVRLRPVELAGLSWKYDGASGLNPSAYGFILSGTKVSASASGTGTLTIFDNGTAVGSEFSPKAGFHNLTVVFVGEERIAEPFFGAPATAVALNATEASLTAKDLKVVAGFTAPEGFKPPFNLELVPFSVSSGVRYFNLKVNVPGGAVVVERAEAVRFDGAVLGGIASTVTPNETEREYALNYTYKLYRVAGAGLLKAVWGIEADPSVSASTPVIHYVTIGKPFVVEADRPVVRVLDSAGGDVAFTGTDVAAVAVGGSGTYTVKLVARLTVTNVYQGKPVEAKVVVKDAKTGLVITSKRGSQIKFELEPGVAYLVEASTDEEAQSYRTTLPQDTAVTFEFTKPPKVEIDWQMVQAIAMIVAVVALITLVVIIKRRGLEITIGS